MNYQKIGLLSKDRIPVLRRRPRVFWGACFVASAIVTVIWSTQQSEPVRFLVLCGVLELAGFLLVPCALHLCSAAFLDWARSAEAFVKAAERDRLIHWYNTELTFFAGTRSMLVASLVFAAVAAFAYAEGGFRGGFTLGGWIWVECVIFVSAFMAGCGLWVMYCGGMAIWRLGARFMDSITVRAGRFGVLSTGRMLAFCWAIIGAVWFMYTLSALFGPEHTKLSEVLRSYPVLLIAVPTLPLICGIFIGCQIPLHRGMMAYKKREIRLVEQRLDEIMADDIAVLAKKRRDEIEFLRHRWSELESLPEWPFGAKSLASVSGSSVMAVLPVVVKIVEVTKPQTWFAV
jgi:hypothetical protein